MKTLIKTVLVLSISFASVIKADESKTGRVLYKAVDSSGQTLPTSIEVEVKEKGSGKILESFTAHSKIMLLPLSGRYQITGLNKKTGETKSQDFSTSFEPSGSSEVILKFEK